MRAIIIGLAFCVGLLGSANAQPAPGGTDLSAIQSQVNGIVSAMPSAVSVVPPVDVFGGAVGPDPTKYEPAGSARPRITRSMLVTTNASGLATADWSAQPLGVGGVVNLTPIYSGSGVPKCWPTAAATTTSVAIKCVIENAAQITLAIITSGLVVNTAANAMQVNVVVLPPSQ